MYTMGVQYISYKPMHILSLCRIGLQCTRPVPGGTPMPASTSTIMAPILARQFCKLQPPPFHHVPSSGIPQGLVERPVATPLRVGAWGKALTGHPNPEWVEALLEGMRQGFRIGIQKTPRCRASPSNSPSVRQHSKVIHQYVQDQLKKGYMAGPLPPCRVCPHHHKQHGSHPQKGRRQVASNCTHV